MISDKNKLIFVHIPKTGGSSIEYCLKDLIIEPVNKVNERNVDVVGGIKNVIPNSFNNIKHATASELVSQYGAEKFNTYLKFAVIRNPWDRLLSLYHWIHNKPYDKKRFISLIPKGDCDDVPNRPKWSINRYVCDNDDEVIVDRLLDFDNLKSDFNQLCIDLSIKDIKLPHINKHKTKLNYKDILDDEVIELINISYKKEIDRFWS
jgi:hypothetical protein